MYVVKSPLSPSLTRTLSCFRLRGFLNAEPINFAVGGQSVVIVSQQGKRPPLLFLVDSGNNLMRTFGYVEGCVGLGKIKIKKN